MIFGLGPLHERRCERGCCAVPNIGSVGEAVTFQANLDMCRWMACSAPNERDRRAWRNMAEKWRLLILMERSEEYQLSSWAIEVRANWSLAI